MSKVYVPMVPSRFDTGLQMWVPTINLDPAKKHGELVIMAPPNANRLNIQPIMEIMHGKMRSFSRDDFLVAVGDPALIAAAVAVAVTKTGGYLRLLKWDRQTSDYVEVELQP
jgi:hypothetical protein